MSITNVVVDVPDPTGSTASRTTRAGTRPPRTEVRATTYRSTVLADPDGLVLAVTGNLV